MTHKRKTETFFQKIEHSGGVIVFPLTPLFSCVTFHLNGEIVVHYTHISFLTWVFIKSEWLLPVLISPMLSHPWIEKENYLVDSVCIGCIGRRNAMTSTLKNVLCRRHFVW